MYKPYWICSGFLLLFLAGCGDAMEVTERAFVMGIALDQAEKGKVMVTMQNYKPSPGTTQGGQSGAPGEKRYFNVTTIDESVAEAIRDIPIHVGNKPHFGHTSAI